MFRLFRAQRTPVVPSEPSEKVVAAVAIALHLHHRDTGPDGRVAAAVLMALRLHGARHRLTSAEPSAWSLAGRLEHMGARVGLQKRTR